RLDLQLHLGRGAQLHDWRFERQWRRCDEERRQRRRHWYSTVPRMLGACGSITICRLFTAFCPKGSIAVTTTACLPNRSAILVSNAPSGATSTRLPCTSTRAKAEALPLSGSDVWLVS